jgi:hypothetical protein
MNIPMNLTVNLLPSMSKKARNMTLLGVAAGIVLIPLVRMGMRWYRNRNQEPQMEGAPPNNIFSAYRGKFKPHHRKAHHNGNGAH